MLKMYFRNENNNHVYELINIDLLSQRVEIVQVNNKQRYVLDTDLFIKNFHKFNNF